MGNDPTGGINARLPTHRDHCQGKFCFPFGIRVTRTDSIQKIALSLHRRCQCGRTTCVQVAETFPKATADAMKLRRLDNPISWANRSSENVPIETKCVRQSHRFRLRYVSNADGRNLEPFPCFQSLDDFCPRIHFPTGCKPSRSELNPSTWKVNHAISRDSPRDGVPSSRFLPDRNPLMGICQYRHAVRQIPPSRRCFNLGRKIQ